METDVPLVALALRPLGTFNFNHYLTMQFVVSCAQNYFTLADMETWVEAIKTCAALLVPMLQQVRLVRASYPVISTASYQVITDMLIQLLTVGITDQGGPSVGWCQGVCTWWGLMAESEVWHTAV